MIHEMAADGMTGAGVHALHGQAERCQRVVYRGADQLVRAGRDADEVVRAANLVTFEATGPGIEQAARRLRHVTPAWRMRPCSARATCVAGMDRAALRRAIDTRQRRWLNWEVEPRLDDVFIHMLNEQDTEA